MMYAILVILLVLVLAAAGFLTYQNSKLVSNQKKLGTSSGDPSLMYSIFDQSSAAGVEEPEAIPLFQYTVFARSNGAVVVNKPVALIILCRVAAGKGDYLLADVERNMLDKISRPMPLDAYSEHKAYLHRTANHTEKEMILNLEDAVNLQYT
ncbi:hypothetical protein [Paenibacillus odorifer]|uniref:hypothetical protein n=1 Tax=Paenibacillus odorifer TaxID=189426 RepID=UPI00096D01DE|nr:hypothetical protein [Paenibacillus odorifer]OMD60917.1 hypothetical protein BSK55_06095 [Paenibacillus odorifer]